MAGLARVIDVPALEPHKPIAKLDGPFRALDQVLRPMPRKALPGADEYFVAVADDPDRDCRRLPGLAASGFEQRISWRRDANGNWPDEPVTLGPDEAVTLESIGFSAPLCSFYRTTVLA